MTGPNGTVPGQVRPRPLGGDILSQAIRATLDRRATPMPDAVPFGLTEDFVRDRRKQIQCQAPPNDE